MAHAKIQAYILYAGKDEKCVCIQFFCKKSSSKILLNNSVENVSLNLGKADEQKLGSISAADAKKYIEEDQFASGSMLPKIEAGISFIEKGEGRAAVITDMAHAKEGYEEKAGTIIR